jgi:hypothetical protein
MKNSETPCSTDVIESLEDIERLLAMMRSFKVGIMELPGGFKFVLEPEVPQPAKLRNPVPELPGPKNIHDDPFLYADGNVPDFSQS